MRRLGPLGILILGEWLAARAVASFLLRRRPPGELFPYSRPFRGIVAFSLVLVILQAPVLGAVSILLTSRHSWVPWAVGGVELYAIWWLISLWTGLVTEPHRVYHEWLVIRAGLSGGLDVALHNIAEVVVTTDRHDAMIGPVIEGDAVNFPVRNRTDVVLRLRVPIRVRRGVRGTSEVTTVRLWCGDVGRLIRALGGPGRHGAVPSHAGPKLT